MANLATVERLAGKYVIMLTYEGNYKGLYKGVWYRAFTNSQDAYIHLRMINEDLSLMREHFDPTFHRLVQDLEAAVSSEIKLHKHIND